MPFDKLSPADFERLCLWLAHREGYSDVEHLGEAGGEQGRDVVAFRDGRRFVFQCKRVQSFGPATARAEIEKLRALPDDEQPDEIVFVVSRAVSAKARAKIREAWGDARTCRFWAGNELDERVKRYPEILGEFFELPGNKARRQDREPGALPPIWTVPYFRNPHFTGRETLLDDLHRTLTTGDHHAALTQTLKGLGGVGKTQLALEYVYRYSAEYEVVAWIAAEEPTTLTRDFAGLAGELGLPEKDDPDLGAAVKAVRKWLEHHGGWILVFDNATEPEALREVLPRGATGHVLITSRRQDWGRIGSFNVRPFERSESLRFLEQRVGAESAEELAEELGDLPLALEQAVAYMQETRISPGSYLKLFRERRAEMLGKGSSEDYPDTVATTWRLSFEQLPPTAADLMRLCAFLAPDDIPRELLSKGAGELPGALGKAAGDPMALSEIIAAAGRLSLIQISDESFSVHRLVQAVARASCDDIERENWASAALRSFHAIYRYQPDDPASWPWAARLLAHVPTVARYGEELEPDHAVGVLVRGAMLLTIHGEWSSALELNKQALRIAETAHGKEHPDVADTANNIGMILQDQGDLNGALEYARRALEIWEAVYGEQTNYAATSNNNIGTILLDQGDLDGAMEYAQRALRIDQGVYGDDNPNVARDFNSIGMILQNQGDLDEALQYVQRALRINKAHYGEDHPNVAIAYNNTGSVLYDQGNLDGALEHTQRALRILERLFGHDHPSTKNAAKGVAEIQQALDETT